MLTVADSVFTEKTFSYKLVITVRNNRVNVFKVLKVLEKFTNSHIRLHIVLFRYYYLHCTTKVRNFESYIQT